MRTLLRLCESQGGDADQSEIELYCAHALIQQVGKKGINAIMQGLLAPGMDRFSIKIHSIIEAIAHKYYPERG